MADVDRKLADLRTTIGLSPSGAGGSDPNQLGQLARAHGLQSSALLGWLLSIGSETIVIDWSAESLFLFGMREIANAQMGYSSTIGKNGRTGTNRDWPQDLFVIATVIADPFVMNRSDPNSEVLFAKHGTGRWDFGVVAGSMETFLDALVVWVKLYYVEFAKSILDSDYSVSQRFKNRLVEELIKLHGVNVANFMKTVDD